MEKKEKFWYLNKFVYCEFLITFICNYNCSYCFFRGRQHDGSYMLGNKGPGLADTPLRKALFPLLRKIGLLRNSDAFMNYSIDEWKRLFGEIFKDKIAYISFTGGEPLIHYAKITELIKTLAERSDEYMVRFDTNGTIVPSFPEEFKDRISYVVSYHKSQAPQEKFVKNLQSISKQGKVLMVNRVVDDENGLQDAVQDMKLFESLGYYTNITPAFLNVKNWKKSNVDLIKEITCDIDYEFRVDRKTKGRRCRYPMFGFRLLPNGFGEVFPCINKAHNLMRKHSLKGLFSDKPMVCQSTDCTCLHAYPFIENIDRNAYSYDILANFVNENKAHKERNLALEAPCKGI